MTYTPEPVPQNDGSPYRWLNCTCAAGATALDRDTLGAHTTTGGRVRSLTGDTVGGTSIDQVDGALRKGWPPEDHLDTRWAMPFDDAVAEVAGGRGAEVALGYDGGFAGSDLDGSPGFTGNHAVFWNAVIVIKADASHIDYEASRAQIYDPLWDGRRTTIPSKMFRWVKLSLLRNACGRLTLSGGGRLGVGLGYFGFTRDTEPTIPKPPPIVPIEYGENKMIVAGGLAVASSHVISLKQGQSVYREARVGSKVLTKMAKASTLDYFGSAATGWRAVLVQTANFPDGVKRPVIAYVPASAGSVAKK